MSSLREQLDAAQQRLDMAEADVTVLQATETNLQQQLRSTQVGYYLTEVLHRSGHNVASVTDVFQIMICILVHVAQVNACLQHHSSICI